MTDRTSEQHAADLITDAYVTDTGGGMMAAQVDLPRGGYLLITDAQEMGEPCGWHVGHYVADDADDPYTVTYAPTAERLRQAVTDARAKQVEQYGAGFIQTYGEQLVKAAGEIRDEDLSCSNCGEADPNQCECASIEVDGAVLVSSVTAFVIEVKGRRVGIGITIDESGDPMLQLTPDGCDLDGEEPGLYYLVEKGSTGR